MNDVEVLHGDIAQN
jgi:ATP-dependent RNA helicase DDX21